MYTLVDRFRLGPVSAALPGAVRIGVKSQKKEEGGEGREVKVRKN